MGLFDRFRSAGQAADESKNKAATSEQEALRLIDAGNVLEAKGQADEALQRYLEAIRIAPELARAHLNHGNILLAKGDLKGALEAFKTAIRHRPDYAGAYYNMGNALLSHGQYNEAVASYRKALEIKPDYAEVHCVLGIALKELGQIDDAVASYLRALEINPGMVEAHSNLSLALNVLFDRGNALASKGQREGAVAIYRQVLEINPGYAEVHCNMGLALQELGRLEEAAACYRRALQIKPDLAEAHSNLGCTLQKLGEFENAIVSYRRALELNPDLAETYSNLGFAQQSIGQIKSAIASCRRAVELNPDFAEAYNNLGIALQEYKQYADAVTSYRRALELKPDFAEAHSNLGVTLKDINQLDEAVACFRRALELRPDYIDAHSNLLFVMNYTASHRSSSYLEQARQYGRVVAAKAGRRFTAWRCAPSPERLRVGLVSGDFRIHSVGHFLEGMLSHIDPARIELIAYSAYHKEDELTARIRPYFSAWKSLVGKSDEAAARLIHADGVHILIDISGHTTHNRLPVFAWKPAPVQVTWLGYFSSTGVGEMDYVLGDPIAAPPEHENHFSEAVWRLPDSYLCFTAPKYPVAVAQLPALSAGHVTFGSFNNLSKMNDEVVELWARILLSVPNSRLYLKTGQLNDADVRAQTQQRFAARGIAPERLLLGRTQGTIADHLAEYGKVDIALDTFPYPGVTTSVEALWMGVPVLSIHGDRFISLTAKSIAHQAGLPDWIAVDKDDYLAKAMAFSSSLDRLSTLRAGLRQQVLASPLFDAQRFARNFEEALWGMWQTYQARER